MKRSNLWISLGVAVAAFLVGAYLWFPAPTPAGQHPLTRLSSSNAGEFAAAFDAAPAGHRVVLLLSPT